MGPVVQVPVHVRGLPVDSDIQVATIFPLEQGIEKGEAPFLLHFHSELDGWPHTVEVAQESFHCAFLHDSAGIIHIPLPEPGLGWGGPECQFFEELHVQVRHN